MVTLFFVHGYASGSISWDLIRPFIDKNKYRAKFFDMVGCGNIKPPKSFGYSLEEQAAHLKAEISKVEGEVILVAHSMGAAVAIISILDFEVEPQRLILVDPLVFPQARPFFVRIQTIPVISAAISWMVPPSFQVDLVLRRISFNIKNINSLLRRRYILAFKKPYHRKMLRKTAVQLNRFNGRQYIERFSTIEIETDVIWAKEDPLIEFEKSEKFKNSIKKCSVSPFERCGHAPQEECPERFAELLLKVLTKDGKLC